jgi:aryl-alcohol dehydrogenase-like predicted oxidoreductase
VDETMRALDDAVRQGKILHVGVSDYPAWKVAQANTLAELRGWTPFRALQVEYSLVQRDVERELVPMARELGLGVTPWAPLAGGVLTGKYARGGDSQRRDRNMNLHRLGERTDRIVRELLSIAGELGRSPAQVAIRWCLERPGVTSPILGARNVEQLDDNLGALGFTLSDDQRRRLDEASAIVLGWPHDFLAQPGVRENLSGGTTLVTE